LAGIILVPLLVIVLSPLRLVFTADHRGLIPGYRIVTVRQRIRNSRFCICFALGGLALNLRQSFNFMKPQVLFCAVACFALLVAGVRLHAQSPGIFVGSNGNVGIGTTSPTTNLDVSANANENGLMTGQFHITGTTNPNQRLVLGYDTTNNFGFIEAGIAGSFAKNIVLDPHGGGNIGIGTASPGASLDVYNPTQSATANPGNAALRVTAVQGASQQFLNIGYDPALDAGYLQPVHSGTGGFFSNLLLSSNGGNVGIGTTTPAQKLDVNGNIRVHGWIEGGAGSSAGTLTLYGDYSSSGGLTIQQNGNVNVAGQVYAMSFVSSTTTYPDFVFKPGYKLAPLSDVEASIKKDGHLPGIPDEKEARAHGIDLASMQVKLLQKIEELTLHQIDEEKHQIEQEKRLNDQARDIEQLRKENAELCEKLSK
jgi:hypothetical protein